MEQKSNNLETIFRTTFEKHSEMPSPKVLRQLKYRLWISDFFSFNLKRPNIIYTAILAGIIATGLLIFADRPSSEMKVHQSQTSSDKNSKSISVARPASETIESDRAGNLGNKEMLSAYFDVSYSEGCAPLKILFNSYTNQASDHKWDFGNGDSSSEQNPSYTYSEPGVYLAKLTVSDKSGYSEYHTREIRVFSHPDANIAIDIDKSDIACRKVQFIGKSKGSSTYVWNFGDNETSTTMNPLHVFKNYGVYTVKLIVTSENGCSDTFELENKFLKNNYQLNYPYTFKPNTTDKGNNGFYESNGAQSAIFYPKNYGVKEYHLSIKAPNGIEVFSTNNIKQGWNGYVRGRLAPGGVYSYLAKGIYPNGKPFYIEGKVKVIIEDYFQD